MNFTPHCFESYFGVKFKQALFYVKAVGTAALQPCPDGFGLLFVPRFVEQGEHILLVGLYARLVERVDSQNVAADAACLLEEVEQTADALFVQSGNDDAYVGHAAVDVGKLCAQFSHFVHFVHTFAGEEIQTIEVLCVGGNF